MRLAPDFDSTLLKRCNTVNSKQMFNNFFADDWIQTADLCYRKRLLYQLSHNQGNSTFEGVIQLGNKNTAPRRTD